MKQANQVLVLRSPPSAQVRDCFAKVAAVIGSQLPHAEIWHVGSTAVPGCLTKKAISMCW
jgi:GrpB-like predicted nucleotidyltransferase (UPF0157 family)